jgi:hypothetical protein
MTQRVDETFAPLHGLQRAVSKEVRIGAALLALFTSSVAMFVAKHLPAGLV